MADNRENSLTLEEIDALLVRVVGRAQPDDLVAWTGVSKRNAERWIAGSSTFPSNILDQLVRLAPLSDRLVDDLRDIVDEYRADGVPENLLRMQLRAFARTLSDEPPPRPGPRRLDDSE